MEENRNNVIPGNQARGWNDPPQFLYDAQGGTITASNPLATNKRVGHDLSATATMQSANSATPPATSPPLVPLPTLASVPILNMPSKPSGEGEGDKSEEVVVPDIEDDLELCQYCVKCFQECTAKLKDEQLLEARLAADVTKRIAIFEKNWATGKLSAAAKPSCAQLARALEMKSHIKAHEIHMKLMTNHVSEVSQWMVGIKKLIQAANTKT